MLTLPGFFSPPGTSSQNSWVWAILFSNFSPDSELAVEAEFVGHLFRMSLLFFMAHLVYY